jgi:hypothetical protein
METFILVPERDYKRLGHAEPTFDDSVISVFNKKYSDESEKAEALQSTLGEYLSSVRFRNLQQQPIALPADEYFTEQQFDSKPPVIKIPDPPVPPLVKSLPKSRISLKIRDRLNPVPVVPQAPVPPPVVVLPKARVSLKTKAPSALSDPESDEFFEANQEEQDFSKVTQRKPKIVPSREPYPIRNKQVGQGKFRLW